MFDLAKIIKIFKNFTEILIGCEKIVTHGKTIHF